MATYLHKKTLTFIHRKTFELLDVNSEVPHVNEHFHVDDLIALPVQILNRKGYTTTGCCSGHLFFSANIHEKPKDLLTFISFEKGISLPSLPPGFTWHSDAVISYKYNIPYKYDANALYGLLRENLIAMEQLYEWALKLPDF